MFHFCRTIFHPFVGIILLCSVRVEAELSNEGILGAPFYGENRDSSGSLVNQVGPTADFSIPTGLSARSLINPLQSGEESALETSLLLDDGSLTMLDPQGVAWVSSDDAVSVERGFARSREVSENLRVAVTASAEGFSTVFFLRLKSAASESESVGATLPDQVHALSDSADLTANGWKSSRWFGNYYDSGNDWIMHHHHGWLYAHSNDPGSLWIWSPAMKWLWTSPEVYPHLYRNEDANWLYFIIRAFPKRLYYNQSSGEVEEETVD